MLTNAAQIGFCSSDVHVCQLGGFGFLDGFRVTAGIIIMVELRPELLGSCSL
jgi:hypothetical protein